MRTARTGQEEKTLKNNGEGEVRIKKELSVTGQHCRWENLWIGTIYTRETSCDVLSFQD